MIMSIKQRKIKIEPRIKLNHNIYINLSSSLAFISKLLCVEENLGDLAMNVGVTWAQVIIPNTEVLASIPGKQNLLSS